MPSHPQDDFRQSRRDLLKKAAIGGGVAAVAWAAPRVEGARIVPDYAAASTDNCVGCTVQIVERCDVGLATETGYCSGTDAPGISWISGDSLGIFPGVGGGVRWTLEQGNNTGCVVCKIECIPPVIGSFPSDCEGPGLPVDATNTTTLPATSGVASCDCPVDNWQCDTTMIFTIANCTPTPT